MLWIWSEIVQPNLYFWKTLYWLSLVSRGFMHVNTFSTAAVHHRAPQSIWFLMKSVLLSYFLAKTSPSGLVAAENGSLKQKLPFQNYRIPSNAHRACFLDGFMLFHQHFKLRLLPLRTLIHLWSKFYSALASQKYHYDELPLINRLSLNGLHGRLFEAIVAECFIWHLCKMAFR